MKLLNQNIMKLNKVIEKPVADATVQEMLDNGYYKTESTLDLNDKKHYFRIKLKDRLTYVNFQSYLNRYALFNKFPHKKLCNLLCNLQGSELPEELLSKMPIAKRLKIKGSIVKMNFTPGKHLMGTYDNGKPMSYFLNNFRIDPATNDFIQDNFPMFSNGVTVNDFHIEKKAFAVMPSHHVRYHLNRHFGHQFAQYLYDKSYLYESNCSFKILEECRYCGKCETANDMVANAKGIVAGKKVQYDHGLDALDEVLKPRLNTSVQGKLLVEVEIDGGKYSALSTTWLNHGIIRALCKSSVEYTPIDLVDLLLPPVSPVHSRRNYRIKSFDYYAKLSGKVLYLYPINTNQKITQEYLDNLLTYLNKYTNTGWKITALKLVDENFSFTKEIEYEWIQYKIDTSKTNVSLEDIKKCVHEANEGKKQILIKRQKNANMGEISVVQEPLDRKDIKYVGYSIDEDSDKIITINAWVNPIGNHPSYFLQTLLGLSDSKYTIKSSDFIKFVEITNKGFYKTNERNNIFNLNTSDNKSSKCPVCGKYKLINVMTNQPFGSVEEEQSKYSQDMYGETHVCHECMSKSQSRL